MKRWWRESGDADAVEAAYGPAIDGPDPTELLIAELDDQPIGMLQRYRLADNADYERALEPAGTPRPAAGLDYLIGVPELTGRGLGPSIITEGSTGAWTAYAEIVAIVVTVQIENRRSWRALEKAGYRRTWSGLVGSLAIPATTVPTTCTCSTVPAALKAQAPATRAGVRATCAPRRAGPRPVGRSASARRHFHRARTRTAARRRRRA